MPQDASPIEITHTLSTDVQSIESFTDKEWLITNGTGSYAMGTASGINTRRYHGLLIAATQPPLGRFLLLNQMLEVWHFHEFDDQISHTFETGTCQFKDHDQYFHAPNGIQYLKQFNRGQSVHWIHELPLNNRFTCKMRKSLSMIPDQPICQLQYHLDADWSELANHFPDIEYISIALKPLCSIRNFHDLSYAADKAFQIAEVDNTILLYHKNNEHNLHIQADSIGEVSPFSNHQWWHQCYYALDEERGQGCREDVFLPAEFHIKLAVEDLLQPSAQPTITVTASYQASAHQGQSSGKKIARRDESSRLEKIIQDSGITASLTTDSRLVPKLACAMEIARKDFLVPRVAPDGKPLLTILAGYPWFSDWGRDTFIALPGLLLTTRQFEDARKVLLAFANVIQDGLIPNRFEDSGDGSAHDNTVDAALHFIRAALLYQQHQDKHAFIKEDWDRWLGPACLDIIQGYSQGTKHNIHMDKDGLIIAGHEQTQLTWMDAAAWMPDGQFRVFTPRHGKAVEINALWYHANRGLLENLPKTCMSHESDLTARCRQIKKSFTQVFWLEEDGYLADHVYPVYQNSKSDPDWSINRDFRPNQLFATCLNYSPLTQKQKQSILKQCQAKLITPVGLRTLDENNPAFAPYYHGPQYQRDAAYHQGTIWPWLLGPYCEGLLRTDKFSPKSQKQVRKTLAPLIEMTMNEHLGQIYEIYEAATYRPVGCMAQAWSVSEIIRSLDLLAHPEK